MMEYVCEGDLCPACGKGHLILPPAKNCSCHLHPPCGACLDVMMACPACGWEAYDDDVVDEGEE